MRDSEHDMPEMVTTTRSLARQGFCMFRFHVFVACALTVAGTPLASAQRRSTVVVTSTTGPVIPHAVVNLNGDVVVQVTGNEGSVLIRESGKGTLRLLVRRIGYETLEGKVARASFTDTLRVSLQPTARTLAAVSVHNNAIKSPFELSGFYSRVQEMQRGVLVGEFLTPEQLDARNLARLSQILEMSRLVETDGMNGRRVLRGRDGCSVSFWIDGTQISGISGASGNGMYTIDDLVAGTDVVAIEIYPIDTRAPEALQPRIGGGSCGVVAVWTGKRL